MNKMSKVKHQTSICEKCGKRHKRLTDKGLCATCDYPGWNKKYPSAYSGKGKK